MQSKLMRWGSAARAASVVTLLATAGCSLFQPQPEPQPPPPPPKPQYAEPLATHTFAFDPKTTRVVGELQVTFSHHEDTFADIARRFNLGWDELVNANPGVDPWLPGEGTRIVLPTQFVLPDAEPEGVVVNLAALRLFYFPKPEKGQPRTVVTYPIGIGMVGWATPTGSTKIVSKRKDPVWTPPASVRKEHAADGDILPPTVPAGPDNPLGAFAMNLGAGWQPAFTYDPSNGILTATDDGKGVIPATSLCLYPRWQGCYVSIRYAGSNADGKLLMVDNLTRKSWVADTAMADVKWSAV